MPTSIDMALKEEERIWGNRLFLHKSCIAWNQLPLHLKLAPTRRIFRIKLEHYLRKQYESIPVERTVDGFKKYFYL